MTGSTVGNSSSRHSSSSAPSHHSFLQVVQEDPAQSQERREQGQPAFASAGKGSHVANTVQWGNMNHRIAHDLVNILTVIQGNTELAAVNVPQHPSLQTYLHNILTASQRGQEYLECMLRETPQQETTHQELDFPTFVTESLELFQATLPSTITIEMVDRLSTGWIMGDSTQLFRMLSNLVSNAVRAMGGQETGTLTVILDKVLELDPLPFPNRSNTAYLRLIVKDTGLGMSADICGRIFNSYFTTQKDGEGTGLGLAIVKEVVNDHNGIVTVESQPGQGSTFTVYLPQYPQSLSQAVSPHPLSA